YVHVGSAFLSPYTPLTTFLWVFSLSPPAIDPYLTVIANFLARCSISFCLTPGRYTIVFCDFRRSSDRLRECFCKHTTAYFHFHCQFLLTICFYNRKYLIWAVMVLNVLSVCR